MVDIAVFRIRIGLFAQTNRNRKYKSLKSGHCMRGKSGRKTFLMLKALLILISILCSSKSTDHLETFYSSHGSKLDQQHHWGPSLIHGEAGQVHRGGLKLRLGKHLTPNFQARYLYGNKASSGIKNMHLNIRSLSNKMSEIKNIIREHKPHIFGLSECEIRRNINLDEQKFKIPGYEILFPKSWSKHGFARVVTYVKKGFQYEQVQELQDDLTQSIWLKGAFRNCKSIYFCHGYREHTSTLGSSLSQQRSQLENFLHQWEEAASHNQSSEINKVHICCEMNLDALGGRWLQPDYHLASLSKLVQSACNMGNFTQLVTVPTRFQYNRVRDKTASSCIDHIYSNTKYRCSDITVLPFGDSDHDILSYIRYSKVPPAPSKTTRRRSYKNFVEKDFLEDLENVDWSEVYQCVDVDVSTSVFTRKFLNVLNIHAPWKVFQQRKRYAPWITDSTKQLMEARDKLKKEAEKCVHEGDSAGAADAWRRFQKARNTVNNRKKFEENRYKSEKIIKSLDTPADTWRAAKSFMSWENKSGSPSQLSVDGILVTKASLIAKKMNCFFLDKVNTIRKDIKPLTNTFDKCKEVMKDKTCKVTLKHATVGKVRQLLKNLKSSKSTSIDEIDSFSVKVAAEVIAQPLHHIITLSIMQSKFPTNWKFSKVIPLHKKESKLLMKNYRPVAILSPFSKILEKVAYEQLYNYFSLNKIFHPDLHGYRQHRSTQTALMTMYDRWVKAAAAGQVSGAVLLDLSAAFDLVDPVILIEKLKIYGVEEDFLSWIESYLTTRLFG